MAAFQFPDPALETTVTNPITGSTYQWKEPPGKWVMTVSIREVGDIIWEGDAPPSPIGDYKLWYSTDTLELYFYYCDAAGTCAWVPTSVPITMLEDLDTAVTQLQSEDTTEYVKLARAARAGMPPADFTACTTQFDWNWTAEEDLTVVQTSLLQADSRLDALEQVTGKTLFYDIESTSGTAPSGSGNFTVNNTNASLVTRIQLGSLDKNGELPQTPVDGDTLLFVDSAGTGIEHRYSIDDASGGLSNMVVSITLDSGDSWVPGVEYETYLFPTNKSAVELTNTAPLSPDIGTIWIDSVTLIWYAWDGASWIPAHIPPSFENRISKIEADVATNNTNIATNTANITANTSDITTNTADILTNKGDIATNTSAISTNTSDIATNVSDISANSSSIAALTTAVNTNTGDIVINTNNINSNDVDIATNAADIATNAADIATKITEADGDARYLQLAGGTTTGPVTAGDKLIVNTPRDGGGPSNSFIVKGNLGGLESQSLLYDFRTSSSNSQDSRVVYKGPVVDDDEITTKKYVDDEIAAIPASSGGNPEFSFPALTSGAVWYELIDLKSNNTYQAIVRVGNGTLNGSTPVTVCVDGTPTRNSIIELGASSGTGSYEFRISQGLTLDVRPLDTGTINISVVILGDADNTAAGDIVTTEKVSTLNSWVETGDVSNNRAGGVFSTSDEVLNYNNKIQLANVADPTDGTMVGNRDYNDARYLTTNSLAGGSWGSSYNAITLTNALAGTDNYRKVVALQVFGGSHTDPPGWGATFGGNKLNFNSNIDKVGLQWNEGSSSSRTVYSIEKASIMGSGNYTRDSSQILLMSNASITTNRVGANTGIMWTFEFFRGNGCGLGCGWTANVHCEYFNTDGRAMESKTVVSCNTQNMSNMQDLILWGQAGYGSFGRWNVVADF